MSDVPELALRYERAVALRLNVDTRWVIGPVSGGARVGYTSVDDGLSLPLLRHSLEMLRLAKETS